jgi:hypothetical protein
VCGHLHDAVSDIELKICEEFTIKPWSSYVDDESIAMQDISSVEESREALETHNVTFTLHLAISLTVSLLDWS